MRIPPIVSLVSSALFFVSAAAFASDWMVIPRHSTIYFSIRHLGVSTVRGQFDKFSGLVTLDEKDPTKSVIEINIDASSINTRLSDRDAKLKSPSFFDIAKYPNITFKSTKIKRAGANKYKVTGDLTMHGVTHPITLKVESFSSPVKNPGGISMRGVSATGKLNRKDWGITGNAVLETGGLVIGEEVEIQIDGELPLKPPGPAVDTTKPSTTGPSTAAVTNTPSTP